MDIGLMLLSGLLAGLLSGAFGIGGGLVIVPILTMAFGFGQKTAQGTSLAMFLIAPSFLATLSYFKAGNVNFKAAGLLWIGTFIGSFISAYFINNVLPDSSAIYLKRAFSILMVFLAVRLWFST